MKFKTTTLKDALLIIPQVYQDNRGFFMESYSNSTVLKNTKLPKLRHYEDTIGEWLKSA